MFNSIWLTSATELLFVFLVTSIIFLYIQYRQRFNFWKKLDVQQLNPIFPVGDLSISGLGLSSLHLRLEQLHQQLKQKNLKYGGIYFYKGPTFMFVAPELIKRVLITDFSYFVDRGTYLDEKNLPITAHMFSVEGEQWRNIRTKCTPFFTSGKMRSMYNILSKNIDNLVEILKKYDSGVELNIRQKLTRLTTDIIGATALGIDCNSQKYPDEEFPRMVDSIFNASNWELFKLFVHKGIDNPGNIVKLVHSNRKLIKYFTEIVQENIEYRDKNNINRDDFLNLMLKLRDTTGASLNDIVAQCYLFFMAGFETSSSTMSNAIHELAFNQQVQDKLRKEVIENLGRDVTQYNYDKVLNLPYLDKVFKETLRKHSVVGMLNRMVVRPYKIPDSKIVLQPGTPVVISILGLHRDPEYYPEPMKFHPERFNNEKEMVPFAYLPFGEGPRNCIGMRFGIMQSKLGLAALVSNFKFLPAKDSKRELSIEPSTKSIVVSVKNGYVPVKMIKI